jgi:DNA-binding transcriptional ArsR family regulator
LAKIETKQLAAPGRLAIVRSPPYIICSMLVKQDQPVDDLDGMAILQALADPVRLEIVRQLAGCSAQGELTCGAIPLPVKKSTASHHFKTLLDAGITAERSEGTRKYLHLRRDELERRFPGLIDSVLRATTPR